MRALASIRTVVPMMLKNACRRSDRPASSFARTPWAAGAFLSGMLSVSAGLSAELRVDGVSILERGVFQASGGISIGESSLGVVTNLRNVSLVQSTVTIRARQSLRFGLRYAIAGAPVGAPVEIRLVTRFPEAGLFDPAAGVRHYKSEYTILGTIGTAAHWMFKFDRSWEIVPGEWIFEFWHAGRNLGSQRFCVLDAETAPSRQIPESCEAVVGRAETERKFGAGRTRRRS